MLSRIIFPSQVDTSRRCTNSWQEFHHTVNHMAGIRKHFSLAPVVYRHKRIGYSLICGFELCCITPLICDYNLS